MSSTQLASEATPVAQTPQKLPASSAAFIQDPIKLMTYDMIDRLTKYVSGEIQATAEDYVLLEQLNIAAAGRYEDMAKKTEMLQELTRTVHARRAQLQPYLDQIDQLHDNALQLTEVMQHLDDYTLELERQFKTLYG